MADKGRFPHYMIKEIFDQPQGLRDTIQPRVSLEQGIVKLDEVRISPEELRDLRRISIVASGTSRHAGPEISIASTKAFTAQMAVLFLFALYLGQVREKLSKEQVRRYIRELLDLPGKVDTVLQSAPECERLGEKYHKVEDFLFLGRA